MTDKTVKVYTAKDCRYCLIVKATLNRNNIPYKEVDATKGGGAREFSQFNTNTVPVVTFGEYTIFDSKQIGEVVQWWNDND